MHWIMLYVMFLFPNFQPQPGFEAELSYDLHAQYTDDQIAGYVDFARACVNGDGPCH